MKTRSSFSYILNNSVLRGFEEEKLRFSSSKPLKDKLIARQKAEGLFIQTQTNDVLHLFMG